MISSLRAFAITFSMGLYGANYGANYQKVAVAASAAAVLDLGDFQIMTDE